MNRLAGAASPYLRQHEANPVDWYPWGADALARARELDRPLFVSIGYSSCHWCHVMAHESFEDETTAAYMNAHFVAVKVDREERPDVDAVYMEAVQAMNGGQGGWPLSCFATPDGRPFFGGTYFPPVPRHGSPAFRAVLEAIADAWSSKRGELDAQADELTGVVASRLAPPPGGELPPAGALLDGALERAAVLYDPVHGGIGRAPKFPQAPILELWLRAHLEGRPDVLDMATATLRAMAAGGIYDHLGGGFARYSTDREWLVPHFEKMLYDQALLARAHLHAWQLTGEAGFRRVLDETLGYVLRDLRDPDRGIRSAEDADSEGEEGRFYTWTPAELAEVLGTEDGTAVAVWYGVTEAGNFAHGRSILHRPGGGAAAADAVDAAAAADAVDAAAAEPPADLDRLRAALLAARARRVRPGIDDKVLTEWNAMAVAVLAEAAAATGEAAWREAAVEVAEHLLAAARRADGRWLRAAAKGGSGQAGLAVATDYAWLVEAFTHLAECTGEARWIGHATDAARGLLELFSAEDGGWYTTGEDAERLVVRPRETYDGVTPSAGSVAALALARLGALTGEAALTVRAEASVAAAGEALASSPLAFPHLVLAALLLERGPVEVVVGQAGVPALVTTVGSRLLPDVVLAWGEPTTSTLWEGRAAPEDDRAYVCRGGTCLAPVRDADALLGALVAAGAAGASRAGASAGGGR